MKVKVRTHPIEVYYLTGPDAVDARKKAFHEDGGSAPCFTTAMFGDDGFVWDTCEGFEQDYRHSFPGEGL
jgi:hypothetical protein